MTAIEKVEALARRTEDVKILWFLEQCEKEGYSLGKTIAELKLVISSEL